MVKPRDDRDEIEPCNKAFSHSQGIVAWMGFPSLREELHSNSTKQSVRVSTQQYPLATTI
ncbi:hypothetical protein [Rickettsia hoogstraalii]|uniref:hypothetical protein n=1 Tax=Rickettsia hoogstraalii TaxID=467174 RepID=UPI0012E01EC4|nr:hypothetical protein [Rickettsia hoogstraalii]